jgi:serine/threonine-protein phosphatase PGAM5
LSKRIYYLVQHGQYRPSKKIPFEGGLTPTGKQQMTQVARLLQTYPIDSISYDDSRQSEETIGLWKPMFNGAVFQYAPRLCQMIPPLPQFPLGNDNGEAKEPLALLETEREVLNALFSELFRPNPLRETHEVVLAHGNAIRYFLCRALNAPLGAITSLKVQAGSVSRVVIEPENNRPRIWVTGINTTAHLSLEFR